MWNIHCLSRRSLSATNRVLLPELRFWTMLVLTEEYVNVWPIVSISDILIISMCWLTAACRPFFLKTYFHSVWEAEYGDNVVKNDSPYCKYNSQTLQLFNSSLYIAGELALYSRLQYVLMRPIAVTFTRSKIRCPCQPHTQGCWLKSTSTMFLHLPLHILCCTSDLCKDLSILHVICPALCCSVTLQVSFHSTRCLWQPDLHYLDIHWVCLAV